MEDPKRGIQVSLEWLVVLFVSIIIGTVVELKENVKEEASHACVILLLSISGQV